MDVGAYIWPAYTGADNRSRIFWPEGRGEWQSVRSALPKFPGHRLPRVPLLGYQDEADPQVMRQQIDLAADHGVNTFIYDWYWYDGLPYLENCLNDGFLKAENRGRMKFYLMWANHDVNFTCDKRISDQPGAVLWQGRQPRGEFIRITERWMERYFTQPNYDRGRLPSRDDLRCGQPDKRSGRRAPCAHGAGRFPAACGVRGL